MSNNYNSHPDSNNNKNGEIVTNSTGSSYKRADLKNGKSINKKIDTLNLQLIYEQLPDHFVQFFFLS